MRQRPLQWLVSRVLAGNLQVQGVGSGAWSNVARTGGAAEGAVIRVWSLDGEGKGSGRLPWDFRPCRAFAAPVVAGGSTMAGSGDGKEKVERKINRAIVARMIRLVGEDGHEVLSRYEALNRAQQAGLDLVEVDGKADPPVCKLMDFSKEKFKVKKQEKDLRKKQLERRRLDDLKEVRFSSRTEQKDLEMKAETVTRLLVRGHRVKLAVQFHGNDKGEEVGVELLERALALLQADVKVENGPRVEKMRAWVMVRPVLEQKPGKKKAPKIRQENVNDVDDGDDAEVPNGVQA
jgi:translation initiation factor IF-3